MSIGSREHPGDESAQLALMRAGRVRAASILTVHGAVLSRLSNELERAGRTRRRGRGALTRAVRPERAKGLKSTRLLTLRLPHATR